MRIISGNFKGKKILEPKDIYTRPLKDLTKESIFNIINHSNKFKVKIEGSVILDLFSGVGSFGIECLSRKADKVYFVENYKNGNLDGAVSLFYTNGQKEWRYNYSNGILNGSYSRWYSNGIKATNGYFENGEPVGLWAWWDKNGVITKKQDYPPKKIGVTRGHNQYTDKSDLVK